MAESVDREAALAQARQAIGLFLNAGAALDESRGALVAAAEARRNLDVWARLDELPLSAVKDTVGSAGVRVTAFEQAGITSVGALMRHDERWLDEHVPGVGPKTAAEVVAAGRRLYWGVARQARALPAADAPLDPTGLALVAAAHRFELADRSLRAGVDYGAQIVPRLQADAAAIEAAPGRLKWRFSGDDVKAPVLAAAADVVTVLGDPAVARFLGELAAAVGMVRGYVAPSPADLAADFARRSADYAAVLDRAGAAGALPAEKARGGLSGEVAERVEGTVVDLTGLKASLRGYQEFGVKYLVCQQRVILGDEMGLGKTMQAIGAMCHVRATEAPTGFFLVVAPASIVPNWERELATRSELPVTLLQGRDRVEDVARWQSASGVAVASFDTLRLLGAPTFDGDAPMPRPALVIVDECHYVKNAAAARSQVVAAWLGSAPRVVLMSGTPLENRVEEFVRLVGLAQPELGAALQQPDNHAALVGSGADGFREQVSPVYLRRNQEDVLTELPEKIEVDEWLDLAPADAAVYREAVIAGEMMAMRQAASLGAADPSAPAAKLVRLAELFEDYATEGRKVLVFSFFRRVIDAVVATATPFLPPGAVVPVVTGDVPPAQRLTLIDRFQQDPGFGVLVAQIDAGGVGLNLQAASVVVLMEAQWKPSTETQAIARAHRMGQTRRVMVHRMLARNAVDETLRDLVGQKQALFDSLVRHSAVAGASADAVDPSAPVAVDPTATLSEEAEAERSLAAQVLATERARLGLGPDTAPTPAPGPDAAPTSAAPGPATDPGPGNTPEAPPPSTSSPPS